MSPVKRRVAVGTLVSPRPPHRSGRAALSHRALTLSVHVEARGPRRTSSSARRWAARAARLVLSVCRWRLQPAEDVLHLWGEINVIMHHLPAPCFSAIDIREAKLELHLLTGEGYAGQGLEEGGGAAGMFKALPEVAAVACTPVRRRIITRSSVSVSPSGSGPLSFGLSQASMRRKLSAASILEGMQSFLR
jgi:hypothetical protein